MHIIRILTDNTTTFNRIVEPYYYTNSNIHENNKENISKLGPISVKKKKEDPQVHLLIYCNNQKKKPTRKPKYTCPTATKQK